MRTISIIITLMSFVLLSCANDKTHVEKKDNIKPEKKESKPQPTVKYPGFEILDEFPHDSSLFTQGLFYYKGYLYESGGMRGQSRIVKSEIGTGKILMEQDMPSHIFSEGICRIEDKIYMLTYTSGKCIVYDLNTFEEVKSYNYFGEGWGIEYDGEKIFMSDGSSTIRILNTNTFTIDSTINVTLNGRSLKNINELEFANGMLYANVWMSDRVVRIDPNTGIVDAVYELSELKSRITFNMATDVLNGIAYNKEEDVFYLTGKLWPKMFVVRLK